MNILAAFSRFDMAAREKTYQFETLPAVVGRSPNADIHVDDRWASRRHCEIDSENGRLLVRDLGSRHGTLVNGIPVIEKYLECGDRIAIGLTELVLRTEEVGMDDRTFTPTFEGFPASAET